MRMVKVAILLASVTSVSIAYAETEPFSSHQSADKISDHAISTNKDASHVDRRVPDELRPALAAGLSDALNMPVTLVDAGEVERVPEHLKPGLTAGLSKALGQRAILVDGRQAEGEAL